MGVSVNAQKESDSEFVQATIRVSKAFTHRKSNPAYIFDCIFNFSSAGREFQKDLKLLHDFTRSVIRQKRAKLTRFRKPSLPGKRKALMDVLLEQQLNQTDSLTEEDIREEVDTFTFAGHDTTSMGVSWALYFIGLYKDVQSRLHDELDEIFGDDIDRPITEDDIREMVYLDRVIKVQLCLAECKIALCLAGEPLSHIGMLLLLVTAKRPILKLLLLNRRYTPQRFKNSLNLELSALDGDDFSFKITKEESQRLCPSIPIMGRRATDDTLINGHKIPEGTACLVFTYELHRDPQQFPDPEKFDPDRFLPENSAIRHPYAYIPFSAGPRNCIGQRFAVLEEKVLIASILRNYTIESLEPRDKVMQATEIMLRNAEPLKIRIRERR